MYCCEWCTVKTQKGVIRIKPLYCNQWPCDECAPRKVREVRKQALAGQPNRFLTLTLRHKAGDDPGEKARQGVMAIRAMLKALEREKGIKPAYMVFIERHPSSGFPHFHLLLRCPFISNRWIRKTWVRLTKSFIIDIRQVKGHKGAARYVSKYLTKDVAQFSGCKRYWRSKGYAPKKTSEDEKPVLKDYVINIVKEHWEKVAQEYAIFSEAVAWGKKDCVVGSAADLEAWLREDAPPRRSAKA